MPLCVKHFVYGLKTKKEVCACIRTSVCGIEQDEARAQANMATAGGRTVLGWEQRTSKLAVVSMIQFPLSQSLLTRQIAPTWSSPVSGRLCPNLHTYGKWSIMSETQKGSLSTNCPLLSHLGGTVGRHWVSCFARQSVITSSQFDGSAV